MRENRTYKEQVAVYRRHFDSRINRVRPQTLHLRNLKAVAMRISRHCRRMVNIRFVSIRYPL